ncbi:MAG: radical SAM protein [Deltaproteobacteria bacterium]|nr:radical SAM protein [Deltaproteobacteria bacterium]
MKSSIILINPWIYDFAAYDMWAKPLGLLYLASQLRDSGLDVHIIDCLDVHTKADRDVTSLKKPVRRKYGAGKFWRQIIPKPPQLKNIARNYSRYGIPEELYRNELTKVKDPAAILVTSLMTYWYPGVFEAIRIAKEIHPHVPIVLGGIYASLCTKHAENLSNADIVIASSSSEENENRLNKFLVKLMPGITIKKNVSPFVPYPSFDLLTKIDYICLLISFGCPFRCPYCASHYLKPYFLKREPMDLFEEVLFWYEKYKVTDFAFYDDALLVDAESHISIVLERIVKAGIPLRFHCPNGLHVAYIDKELASLLYKAGFKTIRLGLETSDVSLHKKLGEKFSVGQFERAVINLKQAGFSAGQIGAYILMGLPGQSYNQVEETIKDVGKIGATPYLSEYSPIPHTRMWEDAVSASRYDIASEPLFHNNTLVPCWDGEDLGKVSRLKNLALQLRL